MAGLETVALDDPPVQTEYVFGLDLPVFRRPLIREPAVPGWRGNHVVAGVAAVAVSLIL